MKLVYRNGYVESIPTGLRPWHLKRKVTMFYLRVFGPSDSRARSVFTYGRMPVVFSGFLIEDTMRTKILKTDMYATLIHPVQKMSKTPRLQYALQTTGLAKWH